MRTIGVLGLLVAAALAGGCGSTTVKTVVKTVQADTPSTTAETTTTTDDVATDDQSCDALGINAEQRNEGTCTRDGATLTIVEAGHEAKLHTLAVTFNGCTAASSVSNGYGIDATAHGTFALCSLTVRNRSDGPQSFAGAGSNQTMLTIDGKRFSEAFDAENQADARAFMSQDGEMQPGETRTGDVIYDLQPRFMRDLEKNGNLYVVNFGDDIDTTSTAALLRTYR